MHSIGVHTKTDFALQCDNMMVKIYWLVDAAIIDKTSNHALLLASAGTSNVHGFSMCKLYSSSLIT